MNKFRSVFCCALLAISISTFSGLIAHMQTGCTLNVSANSSLQSVIDSANTGAVLCLSAGTYKASLVIGKTLILRGAGKDGQGRLKTVLIGGEKGKPIVRVESSQTIQVTLDGIALTEAKATSDFPFCSSLEPSICPNGLQAKGRAKVILQNARVAENEFSGLIAEEFAQVEIRDSAIEDNMDIEMGGVVAREDAQVTIVRSKISGNGVRGLFLAERAKATVSQSEIEEHYNDGIVVRDSAQIELRDSIIEANEACGLRSISSGLIRGSNNKFNNNGLGALCGKVPASLRAPLVPQGNKTKIGVPQDFKTIQEAIDAIAPSGTVVISAGQYEGGLTLYKDITLQGASAAQTIIKGGISVCCDARKARLEKFKAQEAATRAMLVSGSALQVTLSGITLLGATEGGLELSGAVRVDLTDSLIQGIKGLSVEALRVGDGAQATLNNTQILRNEGAGILILDGQVTVTNSQISENQGHGVRLRAGMISLTNSRVQNNNGNGIDIEGTVILVNSQISGNQRNGLRLMNGQVTLSANSRVVENKAHGIEVEGGQLTLSGAEIASNKEMGLSLSGASISKLENTRVLNNGEQGILLEDVAKFEIKTSTIQGNGADGIKLIAQSSATISNNKILNNNGWGVVAALKRCGFEDDRFRGKASASNNDVSGNKLGDVCLP